MLVVGRGQHAPCAIYQRAELQPADAAAMQRFDVVADRGEHPPHLVVAAFVQSEARERGRQHFQLRRQQRHLLRFEHQRSVEHTSELQSLMRTSYAVICLKKQQELLEETYKT